MVCLRRALASPPAPSVSASASFGACLEFAKPCEEVMACDDDDVGSALGVAALMLGVELSAREQDDVMDGQQGDPVLLLVDESSTRFIGPMLDTSCVGEGGGVRDLKL